MVENIFFNIFKGGWNEKNLDDFMSIQLPDNGKSMKILLLESLKQEYYQDITIKF
jgi:hypothetical protein